MGNLAMTPSTNHRFQHCSLLVLSTRPIHSKVLEYLSRRFSLEDRVLVKRVYNQPKSRLLRRRCTMLGWCSPSLRRAA
ncbi:hypothetical protein PC111_g13562 [Phytophthora cactorum]|nr:hypothetical protein PC111_g13562 [Phytophthora cactorum]KAG3151594.1 hypothetical protein C6341_g16521 [Phytophthora cactorum]